MKNAVFTICAKNYLSQAFSLRESTLKHNDVDFFIFLADERDGLTIPELVELDVSWIPNWKSMAFKYDVVEFNTSIKPFCIKKLFSEGYNKVVYLDPDIFVVNSLEYVYDKLETYSVVLTPHRCELFQDNKGFISEETVLGVGVYNLGFIALKNDDISLRITKWWCQRLEDYCYNSPQERLFVDQKWMDMIPGYFPDNVFISHHLGLNMAVWNIQERELFSEEGMLKVRNVNNSKDIYPLVFFHFSGYSPAIPERLDKRIETLTTTTHPEFKILVDSYYEMELKNGYMVYHEMTYSFNTYNNDEEILSLNRRIYRKLLQNNNPCIDPFDASGVIYEKFNSKKLVSHSPCSKLNAIIIKEKAEEQEKKFQWILLKVLRLIGPKRYELLVKACKRIGQYEYHAFLLGEGSMLHTK